MAIAEVVGIGAILVATFVLVLLERIPRAFAFLLGALAAMMFGEGGGFRASPLASVADMTLRIILLLSTMSMTTSVLEDAGAFRYAAATIANLTRGNRRGLFMALSLLAFALSMVINNLTLTIIIVPVALVLLRSLDADPYPYMVAVLMSTNIGGAATAVGDFPNMIIADAAHVSFLAFLGPRGMLPACVVIEVLSTAFLLWVFRGALRTRQDLQARLLDGVAVMALRQDGRIANPRALVAGAAGMLVSLVLFAGSGPGGFSPVKDTVTIALLGCLIAVLGSGLDIARLLEQQSLDGVLVFAALFLLAGTAGATGVLQAAARWIARLAHGDALAAALLVLVPVALATAFIDAGPTTALFIPLVAGLQAATKASGPLLWWGLSLGVLAGSSSTIIGATSGVQLCTILERQSADATRRERFAWYFTRTGVPAALIMLGTGAAFLAILTRTT